MAMSPVELGNENDCAGEDHQKFALPIDIPTEPFPS
jgi:hypothetical protein